jgi:hypothetical protein
MWKSILLSAVLALPPGKCLAAEPNPPVDQVIQLYIQALGGQGALDRISSRQLEIKTRARQRTTYLWQAPNKVLRIKGQERQGFDGGNAWLETKRKKVQKLPHAVEEEMETDANPVRYAHLRQMYTELNFAPRESLDGATMDVLVSPNHIGSTKFFFDSSTHLLRRIEEFGVSSAYFKHVTEFSDYKEFDGIKLPTQIDRQSEEPGAENGTVRLSNIKQNIEINAALFNRPNLAATVLGGKR